jgi:hypothetical protein
MKDTQLLHQRKQDKLQWLQHPSKINGDNITITILDTDHRPVLYLKHDVSETGFCLRRRFSPETENSSLHWAHLSRFRLKTETESSPLNVMFIKRRQFDGQCPKL